jgi:PA14 domain/Dockerin type I domain
LRACNITGGRPLDQTCALPLEKKALMPRNHQLSAFSGNVLDAMGVFWSRVRSKKGHRSPSAAKGSSRPNRRLLAEPLEGRVLLSVGGGFTGAGILGEYFNNTTFSGTPAFTRTDARIGFNWGATDAPGGSTSPGFSSIGTTNYSVLWTGQVIPKYSQTYTFTATTNGGVQLYIQAAGSNTWTTLINQPTPQQSASNYSGPFTVTAGASYNIQMMYVETTGSATAILQWSSPSTPQEIIEPVVQTGINGATAIDYDAGVMFADAMKMARISQPLFGNPIPLDANGWPTSDGNFYIFAGQVTDTSGTYTMTFTGQATVDFYLGTIISNFYDSITNTTTCVFTAGSDTLAVVLNNTRRLPTDTFATGITNIKIMRPISPGATTSYPPTTLFTTAYKNLVSQFTVIRFMDYLATNSAAGYSGGNAIINWSDRLLPSFSSQAGLNGSYQGAGGAIEYAIELCNETDRDLWFNIPVQASDQYVTNLAEGLKFGFDANGNPYTAPTANPVYPPLNPNLKAYLELSNEVWNSGFYQNAIADQIATSAIANNTAIGQIINYDGLDANFTFALGERWQILRTQQISNDFRAVWGNGAMMSTIRPIFQYFDANVINSASDPLQFLDNYFNNTDGNHVATPEPVNYYLYAAGADWYNGVNNASGTNVAAMYASGVQSITSTVQTEVDWDMAFGLQTVGYEGGFDVGGNNASATDYVANVDPQAQQATLDTINEYLQAGGNLPVVFNATGGVWAVAADTNGINNVYDQNTPKLAAYNAVMNALPIANNNSDLVPGVLTPANMTVYYTRYGGTYADSGGGLYQNSGWLSWNIDVAFPGTYTITTATTGAGGSYALLINEVQVASGSSGGNVVGSITLSPGHYDLKIRSTSNTAFQVDQVTVASPITVQGTQVNDGNAQRSMVQRLTVSFDHLVTLDPGAFSIVLHANATINGVTGQTEGTLPVLSWNTSDGGLSYVVTFNGAGVVNNSIADGIYDLRLDSTKVHDMANQTLATDYVFAFFRLYGDFNGDGTVNNADSFQFSRAFNKSIGQAGYLAFFDYNGDGTINNSDSFQFNKRFNTTLKF